MAIGAIFVGHSASTDGGRIARWADKLCGVQRSGAAIAVVSCRCVGGECASAEFTAEEAVDESARRVRGYILDKWVVGLQTRIRLEGWARYVF
jgi:hypothetical protein